MFHGIASTSLNMQGRKFEEPIREQILEVLIRKGTTYRDGAVGLSVLFGGAGFITAHSTLINFNNMGLSQEIAGVLFPLVCFGIFINRTEAIFSKNSEIKIYKTKLKSLRRD